MSMADIAIGAQHITVVSYFMGVTVLYCHIIPLCVKKFKKADYRTLL
jgi:hypothetical protein